MVFRFLWLFLFCALHITTANSFPQFQNDITPSQDDTISDPTVITQAKNDVDETQTAFAGSDIFDGTPRHLN